MLNLIVYVMKLHILDTRLKILDIPVSVCGDYLQEDPLSQAITFSKITPFGNSIYRKLIIRKSRVIGAMVVGECDELPFIQNAIESRTRWRSKSLNRFAKLGSLSVLKQPPNASTLPATARICNCMHIDKGQLEAAVAKGCASAEELCHSAMNYVYERLRFVVWAHDTRYQHV